MELPKDVLSIIREYARPIGLRLDWRLGCYCNRGWEDGNWDYRTYTFRQTIHMMKEINDFRYAYHHIEIFQMVL